MHTVEIKKRKYSNNNACGGGVAQYFAECSCGWNGNFRDTFGEARGDGNEHVNENKTRDTRRVRHQGRFSNPEYGNYMHWEDFIYHVVRARRPYTQRDLVTVLQNYGEGMQQSGFTISEAEDEMEDVRKQIEEEARTANNHPTS